MAKKPDNSKRRTYSPTIKNRKAHHRFHVLEAMEAGVELKGNEVKSVRLGEVSLDESFARIRAGELYLLGCHIKPYEFGDVSKQDPIRPRRLLLHKREIRQLAERVTQKGNTLVPLAIYFKRGKVKIEIALVRGKQLHDKRQDMKKREQQRDIQQAMRRRR
ncbi:MAG: SsrA-binding protein [Phycisphaerae bacterium]|nr:SsrA-binding protein [Phycisphaerae bacterium]